MQGLGLLMRKVTVVLERVELRHVVPSPRDDIHQWATSDRPVYSLVHGVLEVVLVVGLGIRFITHLMGYSLYHDWRHDEPPELADEMFDFTTIAKPLLETEHWHQEALMRVLTFGAGVLFLLWAASTSAYQGYMGNASVTPSMVYWGRLFIATHLCLDPVLGIAWRLATAT